MSMEISLQSGGGNLLRGAGPLLAGDQGDAAAGWWPLPAGDQGRRGSSRDRDGVSGWAWWSAAGPCAAARLPGPPSYGTSPGPAWGTRDKLLHTVILTQVTGSSLASCLRRWGPGSCLRHHSRQGWLSRRVARAASCAKRRVAASRRLRSSKWGLQTDVQSDGQVAAEGGTGWKGLWNTLLFSLAAWCPALFNPSLPITENLNQGPSVSSARTMYSRKSGWSVMQQRTGTHSVSGNHWVIVSPALLLNWTYLTININ